MNWNSANIEQSILTISTLVNQLTNILQVTKNNASQILSMMKLWSAAPAIERKDGKKLLNMEEKTTKLNVICEQITKDGIQMHKLLAETREVLLSDESSQDWIDYLVYMDTLIFRGFFDTIQCSLQYILNNTTETFLAKNELPALFEAKLELNGTLLMLTPSLDEGLRCCGESIILQMIMEA